MKIKFFSKGRSQGKSRRGILVGIPLLLFTCGVALITIGTYKYAASAYYISSLFIQDEAKPEVKNIASSSAKKTTAKKVIFPSLGDKFGDLIIKKASINIPVYHGDREIELLKGAGHYNGSRFPGEGGNVVLAGHRNSVFKNLKSVAKGDTILFNTTYGNYTYKITEIKIVKGTDESIVQPQKSEKLTLYTCYPFNYVGNAPNRYVVICDLVEGPSLKELLKKKDG
jgi:sortase A